MKKLFEIDENEKRRILEMHENATRNLYLMEQPNTDPLVSKEGGFDITTTVDDEFGNPQTSKTNVALPGIQDIDTLNKFVYGWGGETLCDKMKFLENKNLKNVWNYTTDRYCKRNSPESSRTGAHMLRDVVDTALLNIAQNMSDLPKIASGTIGQNTMSKDNEDWSDALTDHPNLPEVIRTIAKEQVAPIMANVELALAAAKSGLKGM